MTKTVASQQPKTSAGHRGQRRSRRGVMLLELLMAMGAAALVSLFLLRVMGADVTTRRAAFRAQWVASGRNAMELWTSANSDSIKAAFTALGCSGTVCRASIAWDGKMTASPVYMSGIPFPKDAGFLPSGWNTGPVYGRVLQATIVKKSDGNLDSIVFTQGSPTLTRGEAWNTARLLGPYGGVFDPTLSSTSVTGVNAGWSADLTSSLWTARCVSLGGDAPGGCFVPGPNEVVAATH